MVRPGLVLCVRHALRAPSGTRVGVPLSETPYHITRWWYALAYWVYNAPMKQLNRRSVTIDADLWRRLKVGALTENLTVSEHIVRLLRRAIAPTDGKK